jgi:hypothetical protein
VFTPSAQLRTALCRLAACSDDKLEKVA